MKKITINQEDRTFVATRVYNGVEGRETIKIYEQTGKFFKRNKPLGYAVVTTEDCEDFADVCCKALEVVLNREA